MVCLIMICPVTPLSYISGLYYCDSIQLLFISFEHLAVILSQKVYVRMKVDYYEAITLDQH